MSSIESLSSGYWKNTQNTGATGTQISSRATQTADTLFSQMVGSDRDYLEASDLEAAIGQLSGVSGSAGDSDASELLAALDTDADGKVTREEFSDSMQQVLDRIDSEFARLRMQSGLDETTGPAGFTQAEMAQQLADLGSEDSARSASLSGIVENFAAVDTDQDGRVSLPEAMAYNAANGLTGPADAAASSAARTATGGLSDQVLKQIADLMEAYDLNDTASGADGTEELSLLA
jgi:Ca2+-binding EF-hand superfamily protein